MIRSLRFLIILFRGEAMMKTQLLRLAMMSAFLLIITIGCTASGQNRESGKIELRTLLVSLNVLVTEKRTGVTVVDLVRDNFEVVADRKPRAITHFSMKEKRRPLALVLVLDLAPNGAGRFFRQPDILDVIGRSLLKAHARR